MRHCALCAFSWQIGRIRRPACGEEDPEKLPSFAAPQHAGVRVEACESSKTYVKSIDMTLDARRVPEIDELVALSLDLGGVARVSAARAGSRGAVSPTSAASSAPRLA